MLCGIAPFSLVTQKEVNWCFIFIQEATIESRHGRLEHREEGLQVSIGRRRLNDQRMWSVC